MRVSFLFPYREVSGVPVLFSNLADTLSLVEGIDVSIIDYVDGFMSRSLSSNKRIRKVFFRDGYKMLIDSDVLVLQSIVPWQIRPEIRLTNTTKLLFWNLHPENLIINHFPFKFIKNSAPKTYNFLVHVFSYGRYKSVQEFIVQSRNRSGLFFMDRPNLLRTLSFYSLSRKDDELFLPIACSDGFLRSGIYKFQENQLSFAWIGRLVDFKINSLILLIQELSNSSKSMDLDIALYIVGEGQEESSLRVEDYLHDNFRIIRVGTLTKADLDRLLVSKIDVNVSMGTSALEGAKFGIPTIVMDYDYQRISRKYKFRWLHDTVEFDLGHKITREDCEGRFTMSQIINLALSDGSSISERSYMYYLKNHSLKSVALMLRDAVMNTSLHAGDIDPRLFQKGLLRRLYEYKKYGKIKGL